LLPLLLFSVRFWFGYQQSGVNNAGIYMATARLASLVFFLCVLRTLCVSILDFYNSGRTTDVPEGTRIFSSSHSFCSGNGLSSLSPFSRQQQNTACLKHVTKIGKMKNKQTNKQGRERKTRKTQIGNNCFLEFLSLFFLDQERSRDTEERVLILLLNDSSSPKACLIDGSIDSELTPTSVCNSAIDGSLNNHEYSLSCVLSSYEAANRFISSLQQLQTKQQQQATTTQHPTTGYDYTRWNPYEGGVQIWPSGKEEEYRLSFGKWRRL